MRGSGSNINNLYEAKLNPVFSLVAVVGALAINAGQDNHDTISYATEPEKDSLSTRFVFAGSRANIQKMRKLVTAMQSTGPAMLEAARDLGKALKDALSFRR